MAIVRWDPFRDIMTLRDRMDRLFEDSLSRFRGSEGEYAPSTWTPAVDIYETNDSLVINAEIPGVDKKDISIEVKGNALFLKGERKFEKGIGQENYYRIERSYGSFRRVFSLPENFDKEKIGASFRNGVLEITLPRMEEAKLKQINVRVE